MYFDYSTKKITSLILLLIFSISSIGFSADLHYCGGHLKGISLVGKAKSCHEKSTKPSCHKTSKTNAIESIGCQADSHGDNGCCQNDKSYSQLDFDGTSTHSADNYDNTIDYAPLNQIWSNHFTFLHARIIAYTSYPQPPPLSGWSVRIKMSSFLC
jgi:hypothetical protein